MGEPSGAHSEIAAPPQVQFDVPRQVKWGDEDSEKTGLLSGVPPTGHSSSIVAPPLQFGTVEVKETDAPGVEEMTKRPADLHEIPASESHWPPQPIKIACPMCGIYTYTTTEDETECVGFTSLCSDGPLFRNIKSHYCPRCANRVGLHYTGDTCGRGAGCCHIQ